jgi:hypothetical protein
MKPTHDDIAAQTAAFLASGGKVKEMESDSPEVAQARFYNSTAKITKARYERGTGKKANAWKVRLLTSSTR